MQSLDLDDAAQFLMMNTEDFRTVAHDNLNNAQYDLALACLHLRYALGSL